MASAHGWLRSISGVLSNQEVHSSGMNKYKEEVNRRNFVTSTLRELRTFEKGLLVFAVAALSLCAVCSLKLMIDVARGPAACAFDFAATAENATGKSSYVAIDVKKGMRAARSDIWEDYAGIERQWVLMTKDGSDSALLVMQTVPQTTTRSSIVGACGGPQTPSTLPISTILRMRRLHFTSMRDFHARGRSGRLLAFT